MTFSFKKVFFISNFCQLTSFRDLEAHYLPVIRNIMHLLDGKSIQQSRLLFVVWFPDFGNVTRSFSYLKIRNEIFIAQIQIECDLYCHFVYYNKAVKISNSKAYLTP